MPFRECANDKDVFYYDKFTLKNSNEEEILGVTRDTLTFHQHIKNMSAKACQDLSVLLRISQYLDH